VKDSYSGFGMRVASPQRTLRTRRLLYEIPFVSFASFVVMNRLGDATRF